MFFVFVFSFEPPVYPKKNKDNMIATAVITDERFYSEVLNLNVLFRMCCASARVRLFLFFSMTVF